jgi:uncharacterized protein involved in exopolysaccharide biosynthesis
MQDAADMPEVKQTDGVVAGRALQPDGVVYFLPSGHPGPASLDIDLMVMFGELWRSRWLVMFVTLLATISGVAYALLAQPYYRAEVAVIPVDSDPTNKLMSQFGGLASLVGVNVGTANDAEPMAVLQSRQFAAYFIEKHGLLPILFAKKWDRTARTWRGPQSKWPDSRDGVTFFNERVRHVMQDRKTGIITITVTWKDPQLAASWAQAIVDDVNEQLRTRTIARSQANVNYLKAQIAATDVVALQQPAGKLLELEMQKLMLANGDPQFAFRVVDEPRAPKKPLTPRKKLVVAGALIVGFLLTCLFVVVRLLVRQARSTNGSA